LDPGGGEQVGHQFGCNGNAGFIFAVLAGKTEIGDHGDDVACRCPAGCIDEHEQFEKVRGRCEGRLNDKDVISPDIFLKRGLEFAIAEIGNNNGTELGAIAPGDFLSQVLCGAAGENFYFVGHIGGFDISAAKLLFSGHLSKS
jgi:hypothetical protein